MLNRLFIAIAVAATAQHAVAFIGLPHAAPAPDGDVPPTLMRRLGNASTTATARRLLLKDSKAAAEAALAGDSDSDNDNDNGKHKDEGESYFIELHALSLVKELKDDDDSVPCSEKCQDMGRDVGRLCLDAGDAWNVRVGEKLGKRAGSGK
ncbi:hypothetical protein F4809DRAFT_646767 [Biscogniauxia mediterranea]|nr:hypothetical protein F4809DRAFT_646767 [Biscogniauxia mediterranea]